MKYAMLCVLLPCLCRYTAGFLWTKQGGHRCLLAPMIEASLCTITCHHRVDFVVVVGGVVLVCWLVVL